MVRKMKKEEGFTLIEVLVVVSIIGLLSSMILFFVSSVRVKARDAKRVADVTQLTKALELYYTSVGQYPISLVGGASERPNPERTDIPELVSTYIAAMPKAPSPPDSSACTSANNQYKYRSLDGTNYSLTFCIGTKVGSFAPGYYMFTADRRLLRYDINADGVVDGGDVQYLTNSLSPDCTPKMEVCDVNFNGTATSTEAQCLQDIFVNYPNYPNSTACLAN